MISFESGDIESGKIVNVSVVNEDLTLPELCQAFEDFIKACGYHLPEGAHIGYEYDEAALTEREQRSPDW